MSLDWKALRGLHSLQRLERRIPSLPPAVSRAAFLASVGSWPLSLPSQPAGQHLPISLGFVVTWPSSRTLTPPVPPLITSAEAPVAMEGHLVTVPGIRAWTSQGPSFNLPRHSMYVHKRDKRRKEGRRGERWRQSIVFPPRRSDPAIALMTEERTLERQGLWKRPPFRGGAWWKGGNRAPLWCFWLFLLSSHQTACIWGQAWGAGHGARREFG